MTSKYNFSDSGTRSDIEKARAFLITMANPNSRAADKYFFDDGFPRTRVIEQDAAATLRVMNDLNEATNG